jgi:small-conductance mechanosensitive channel
MKPISCQRSHRHFVRLLVLVIVFFVVLFGGMYFFGVDLDTIALCAAAGALGLAIAVMLSPYEEEPWKHRRYKP